MSVQTIADQKDLIRDSLFTFIQKHVPGAQLGSIDEIVLNYCVSILEELGESAARDDFDPEDFCEMVEAFIPEFSSLPHSEVAKWVLELESSLRKLRHPGNSRTANELASLLSPITIDKPKPVVHIKPDGASDISSKRIHQLSETSDGSSDGSSSGDYMSGFDEVVYLLHEMFPAASLAEVQHCVSVAEGDAARAAQLMMDRQEAGLSIPAAAAVLQAPVRQKTLNDHELKNRIIEKYSYVDRDEDQREHHPIAPKTEPKKLVRYRDNKVVSLKGERYTEVKREDQEEPKRAPMVSKPTRRTNKE